MRLLFRLHFGRSATSIADGTCERSHRVGSAAVTRTLRILEKTLVVNERCHSSIDPDDLSGYRTCKL